MSCLRAAIERTHYNDAEHALQRPGWCALVAIVAPRRPGRRVVRLIGTTRSCGISTLHRSGAEDRRFGHHDGRQESVAAYRVS